MASGTAALSTLQQRIDSLYYPPTHTYQLEGLKPNSSLAERLAVIEKEFPDFFQGDLLDVGCNKGFFALYHKGTVTGIDPGKCYIELCKELKPDSEFIQCSFMDLQTDRKFDRIFIGNGPHYPFIEAKGWSWVKKLEQLSIGQVLLEGPTGMEGRDAKNCIPKYLQGEYTNDKLLRAFEREFFFIKQVKSPLVDRYFTLFLKKDELVNAPMGRYADYLRIVYCLAVPYIKPTDTVMEICTRHDRGVISKTLLPHVDFITVDRNPKRPGLNLDAVTDELPICDVLISTAILHHTAPDKIETLFNNLARNTRRCIILSGPSSSLPLIGDHKYHIDADEIEKIAVSNGWHTAEIKPCGLSKPYCEIFMVFEK